MNYLTIVKTSINSLSINKGRSFLTILGIMIGIIAIVLVIALGQGAKQLILGEIENIGANTIIVRPGRQPEGPTDLADTILADSITTQDIIALEKRTNVPGVISVQPAVLVSGEAVYQDRIYRPFTFGWSAEALAETFDVIPSEGTTFTDEDTRQHAKVAVLGSRVKQELFGESDAVGKFIKIRGVNLRVVGVYAPRGQILAFNVDELILIPHTTAQKDILGINHFHEVFVRTDPTLDPEVVVEDIRATLREIHGITDPDKDDFFALTQTDIAESLSDVTTILTIFLIAMASISLIVGSVGIMNIMLVSVTERTREIGLRKSVGATKKDISNQFLIEAIILTVSGGVIGTFIAALLSVLITIIARTKLYLVRAIIVSFNNNYRSH